MPSPGELFAGKYGLDVAYFLAVYDYTALLYGAACFRFGIYQAGLYEEGEDVDAAVGQVCFRELGFRHVLTVSAACEQGAAGFLCFGCFFFTVNQLRKLECQDFLAWFSWLPSQ